MISSSLADVRVRVEATRQGSPRGPLDLGVPITERILRRVPGPRWALITLWAAAVLMTPLVVVGTKELSGAHTGFDGFKELASQAVLSYVVALLLYGVARLVDHATALGPDVEVLTANVAEPEPARRRDVAGPLVLSVVVILVASGRSWSENGVASTIVILPFLALAVMPVMTFVWTYVWLLIGLDRLGRFRLALHPFPQDRSLGLGAVGSLAFSGFALLVAAAVPTLLATTGNPNTFVIVLAILGVNVPIFFRSMWRLHHQMSAAKARYVTESRALYAAAYQPLRHDPRLSVLRRQAGVLDAARALEERAERIQAWPIDDGLMALIGFVLAGVTSGVVVRLIAIAVSL